MKKYIYSTLSFGILITSLSIAAPLISPTVPVLHPPTQIAVKNTFTEEQKQEIEKIIYNYLITNPKVLIDASQALQKEEEAKQQEQAKVAIKNNAQKLFQDPNSPTAGNLKGGVTLVEFFDYQCGHCKEMNPIIQNLLRKNKNLRVVFKELPIFGRQSKLAAEASLASFKQGKYYSFHYALLKLAEPLTNRIIFQIAKKVGLNLKQLKQDMKDPSVQKQLKDNFQLSESLQVLGTPTFFLSNKSLNQFRLIPGATSEKDIQNDIDQLALTNK